VANKYYLLFQHHLAPPVSTYTTGESEVARISNSAESALLDAPQTTSLNDAQADARHPENTFFLEEKEIDSSYIIGSKPGVRITVLLALILVLIFNSLT
jgi:hypothetical protein